MITHTSTFSSIKRYMKLVTTKSKPLILIGPVDLPIDVDGQTHLFKWYTWLTEDNVKEGDTLEDVYTMLEGKPLAHKQLSSILVYGDFESQDEAYVRLHSICHTGDVFGSLLCDCGEQFKAARRMIVKEGCGAIFYLADQEGRGIGLYHKAMAYLLQKQGLDTVEANKVLGFEDDLRSYDEAISVLKILRNLPINLITNNSHKVKELRQGGIAINKRIPVWCEMTEYNERYIETKIERSGHIKGNLT
ncbi:GTP cyclohydrolase II [Priestia megaterium]|uniref:GTP cyclohydrolase II n=1 Tax=Priestia megaterium TaxID=1404 RepID=UPI001F4A09EF|nr:GTP cyclohydrolase II [Priestia megaterium]MED3866115.1 GTP cyclohydrolase II [Priestia megaterium]MED4101019.1 GTP cyclohydrolase II [Priestia megaterium]MED4145428.1 GTP cyclohydrolase II [Priestia megaterium]MED4202318.1 GTP cyclohydrolase II [Priestia megaterium]